MAGNKNPAFQFYPNDWNRDMEEYPLEIQGAWIVVLCKLWWSETRGEATKTLDEWARVLREKNKKTSQILEFFQKKNIANIIFLDNQKSNQNVTIISRRMVKDHEISQIRRKVGKLGGNPGLLKIKENKKVLDNQSDNQNDQSPSPTPSPSPVFNNIPFKEIINDLNLVLKKQYKPTARKTRDLIKARYNDGFEFDDFKYVHRVKNEEWGDDIGFKRFLRPETLYGNKFESYRNQDMKNMIVKAPEEYQLPD